MIHSGCIFYHFLALRWSMFLIVSPIYPIFNIMAAADFAIQGARASAAMLLNSFSQSIPVLAQDGLKYNVQSVFMIVLWLLMASSGHFNSLPPGRCGYDFKLTFKSISGLYILHISCEIASRRTSQDRPDDWSALVHWCRWWLGAFRNKPLPEPMLTQISFAIWHH